MAIFWTDLQTSTMELCAAEIAQRLAARPDQHVIHISYGSGAYASWVGKASPPLHRDCQTPQQVLARGEPTPEHSGRPPPVARADGPQHRRKEGLP